MKPVYTHDCEHCTYHGTVQSRTGRWHDLYSCDDAGTKSVIARDGNEPWEYACSPISLTGHYGESHPLKIAAKLAE